MAERMILAGDRRPFAKDAARVLVGHDLERARGIAALVRGAGRQDGTGQVSRYGSSSAR